MLFLPHFWLCIDAKSKLVFYTEKRETAEDLLYILGPFRGITEGHESTVGQDGEHDQHAEHRRNQVKEHSGTFMFFEHRILCYIQNSQI